MDISYFTEDYKQHICNKLYVEFFFACNLSELWRDLVAGVVADVVVLVLLEEVARLHGVAVVKDPRLLHHPQISHSL